LKLEEHSLIINSVNSNDNLSATQTIQEELDALRNSSHISAMRNIERGRKSIKEGPQQRGLRRSASCVGIAGEQVNNCDLDEETMEELSTTNKMVKAMFESSAPKYTFGGSGSNLNLTKSKEDLATRGPITRPSVKPKEERKWVVDTIHKYFDVIVEDEGEEDEEEEEYCEDDIVSDDSGSEWEEYSEYDDDDDQQEERVAPAAEYKSSTKIRGLLGSVASKLTKSMGNIAASSNLVSNLKKNLGSQISVRNSSLDIHCD